MEEELRKVWNPNLANLKKLFPITHIAKKSPPGGQ